MVKVMKLSAFKSGKYIKQTEYKSFLPVKINNEWEVDQPKLQTILEETHFRLGELNAYSRHIPKVNTFIRMHIIKEATKSSRIEGTQTEIEEAVRHEKSIDPEKKEDWREVQNYIRAMDHAVNSLQKLPLSTRLLREAHRILMQGIRGQHKMPGDFRKSQNWIGGATITDAVYIPPHHSDVPGLMSDLEQFLHNRTIHVPHLIRIAIAHYQFEVIHPFLDGNGRIGRLLITLYLVSHKILNKPLLYLSSFFEKNRQLYYDNLNRVRTHNDLVQWIKFFLIGVNDTAQNAIDTLQKILILSNNCNDKILTLGKRVPIAKKMLNYLFKFPTITSNEIVNELQITKPTANAIINEFLRLEILRETTGFKRNRIFVFETYLKLFRD
jgi:Fic family protein